MLSGCPLRTRNPSSGLTEIPDFRTIKHLIKHIFPQWFPALVLKTKRTRHYLHIDAETCMIGGGAYFLEKDPLRNVRNAIVHDQHFLDIISNPNFIRHFGGLHEAEKNKIIPQEYKAFSKIEPLIANKQFFVMKSYSGEGEAAARFLGYAACSRRCTGILKYFFAGMHVEFMCLYSSSIVF